MQFIKPDVNLDFIGKRKIAFGLSALMILISIFTLFFHKGPKYGIDFAGGTLIQAKFDEKTDISAVKDGLASAGVKNATVQRFGSASENEFLIRSDISTGSGEEQFSAQLESTLLETTKVKAEIRRVEMVGPQVGKDLREKALFAMFYALILITVYISGRFELKWMLSIVVGSALAGAVYLLSLFDVSIPFLMLAALIVSLFIFWFLELKYAMGAIVALIHDVFITVGIFSIFGKEFTLPIVAALLTIIGYSLNDTIIVYDRIRENRRKYHKNPLDFIINRSVNETLSRTILTSMTTLVVVLSLYLLGGGIIHDFAFALLVGITVGTYSSIYVASPILLTWQKGAK